ncbi:hypothetical protein EVAR_100577_1 [Eumeta japonica]|uniref:Uncharacterized protein n=1 Tax=Eumeta variegata TaxID=151549 RepID=A0A4C1YEE2_EUMVA|nr:hypothetical protein EVAR_100577_1 [Eumeta japonica]
MVDVVIGRYENERIHSKSMKVEPQAKASNHFYIPRPPAPATRPGRLSSARHDKTKCPLPSIFRYERGAFAYCRPTFFSRPAQRIRRLRRLKCVSHSYRIERVGRSRRRVNFEPRSPRGRPWFSSRAFEGKKKHMYLVRRGHRGARRILWLSEAVTRFPMAVLLYRNLLFRPISVI